MPAAPAPVLLTDPEVAALHRRALTAVVVSQVLGGAGLAAGVTVGALLAQDLLGGDAVAGLPAALTTLGSAGAAYGVGRLSQRSGRRVGLGTGFAVGAAGGAGVVVAAVTASPVLLFASLLLYGAGTATNLQARYAGTDLAPPQGRATAASTALVATTFGAVAGPASVDLLGRAATAVGIPALAGPFALSAAAYALAGLALVVMLRPDPLLVAREQAQLRSAQDDGGGGAASGELRGVHRSGVAVGATVMVLTQVAMVAIMTMTPVHMRLHHGLGAIGVVIALHISAMFLPSLVTGRLVDRWGRVPVAMASAGTLLAAGVVAALAPAESFALLALALVLLGLGWNFGLISGTALIIDATDVHSRARVQGSTDVLVALAGATGGALSGVVVAGAGFAVLALGGGALALLLVPVVALHRRSASAGAVPAP